MSTGQQIQKTILDVVDVDDPDTIDWSYGYLKRLQSATSTLYNASLNKVMLRPNEEAARCHICAYMACQKLQEKNIPDLQFYMDNIPLEPKKINHLLDVFKQQLYQLSPIKGIQWSPSPKKKSQRNSPLKNNDRFIATDPKVLREQLFGTPSKRKGGVKESSLPPTVPMFADDLADEPPSDSPLTPRRKLAFEEDDSDDERTNELSKRRKINNKETGGSKDNVKGESIFGGKNIPHDEKIVDDSDSDDNYNPANENSQDAANDSDLDTDKDNLEDVISDNKTSPKIPLPTKIPRSGGTKLNKTHYSFDKANLLTKRFGKPTLDEVIQLCNQFELPKAIALHVLDSFLINANYLMCPWQFLCGLVMNCVYVIFHERRSKDPRVDHLIMEKMLYSMHCSGVEEVVECIKIVREVVTGEKWFRDMQINNNYFDGQDYEEVIIGKLGSMLQKKNYLVTDDQFAIWRRRIEQDLSMRSTR
ncbi:similar to Saccharomyces cerevisiae YHR118C ORC6 Subunit of the origin recognition complex [Maudiozyma barnettii]|uniref:Similar to Saccharomyces cerevisiae YHR118C ORC6 Subunit of the origin recognition complex n=1 Tax=Maudiozyma barnettii TaxID=61262 RepID=A0A8H2VEN8_9SACH|nr:origin recognition complex subunit 6 [Kazachstania barnettii]CAB4254209.1 similar to Saccharomyces cerevisiae YHR118C ORC6 Subunit of the origin recognition complex [Kazachstania barnettii]CAD1781943.1 similar to Saccharomyces cerevisiae YHR118C ORC6 Subunit of the origin recognition complex [Kazachstania barnettii]